MVPDVPDPPKVTTPTRLSVARTGRARVSRVRRPAWLGSVLVHCAVAALLVHTASRWSGDPAVGFAPTVALGDDTGEPPIEAAPPEPELPVLALPDVDTTPLDLPELPAPEVQEPEPPPQAEPAPLPVPPPVADRFTRIRLAPRRAATPPRAAATPAPAAPAGPALSPPRFASPPRATFPTGAGSGSGRVVLRILVSAAGVPGEIVVHVSSGDAGFDLAARESAAAWRFLPARRGDTPVPAWVEVPVRYQE